MNSKKAFQLSAYTALLILAAAGMVYWDTFGLRTALHLDTKIHEIKNINDGQVVQQAPDSLTTFTIAGGVGLLSKQVRISAVEYGGSITVEENWRDACTAPHFTEFSCPVTVAGNKRFSLNFESISNYRRIRISNPLRIATGDVFVIAGQSNAAGECNTLFTCRSDSIRCGQWTGEKMVWKKADDPQVPGNKGSVWPIVGNYLCDSLNMHIGFINLARGGSSVRDWLPGSNNFETLVTVINSLPAEKCKAVLWHQGESDQQMTKDEYAGLLSTVVSEFHKSTGTRIPWMVAQASYVYGQTAPAIRSAQEELWKQGVALQGPDTDSLRADCRESDNLHFNRKGTERAALLWFEKIMSALY